jgi:putative DNA primase/helicase
MNSIITPSLSTATIFLDTLEPQGKFTFQTFDDDKSRNDKNLVRVLHGTLNKHATTLTTLNQKGAGIFVTVNQTNLKGRKATDIVKVRAAFLDLDGSPLEPVLDHTFEPHIIVESSPSRWHAYWLCELPCEEFLAVQLGLAEKFNGDTSVHDLPRVMRLPGFYHLKCGVGRTLEPFQTRIEQIREN